jgi:hypothetical protein
MTLLQLARIGRGGSRDAGVAWLLPGQHWFPGGAAPPLPPSAGASPWQWAGLINRESLPQRSATALYAKGGWVCIQVCRGSRRHRWGLIVLLHPGQRVSVRSPEGRAGEGGELGVGGEQHQLLHFRLGGLHPIQSFAVRQGA